MAATSKAKIDPADLIDIPGAAKLVFVAKKTISNWLSEGTLTRYKLNGGRTLVSRSELLGLIKREA